ncbi:MAG: DUF5658 family protein [Bdellovibrionota bacterium]|nr:DUF5658 family protein [Pseudomonadota bacterium]MDY6089806.1 DUF5658 family protein [Bdellovibrionota bacterium]
MANNNVKSNINTPSKEVIVLGLILISLQVLDAILTNIGMNLFGTEMEGNSLLRCVMENCGTLTALVVSKAFAIATIIALVYLSNQVKWIKVALKGVIVIYFSFAIAPWTILISQSL